MINAETVYVDVMSSVVESLFSCTLDTYVAHFFLYFVQIEYLQVSANLVDVQSRLSSLNSGLPRGDHAAAVSANGMSHITRSATLVLFA